MARQLALVLSGGGSRGALQAGALRALAEASIQPDLVVGTSAGAINATYVALRGLTPTSMEALARDWREAAASGLMSTHYVWATLSSLFNRSNNRTYHRMREFFIAHGVTPELRFGDITGVRLIVVAADLNCGCPVLYGLTPEQSVLEGLLASAALPPWVPPIEKDGQLLIDGGAVSTLPIEPALSQGATEIIALDLSDPREFPVNGRGWLPMITKLFGMAEHRQMELELALAKARGVPVRHIVLRGEVPVAVWDFRHTDELIARGYDIARQEIARYKSQRPAWRRWLERLTQNTQPATHAMP